MPPEPTGFLCSYPKSGRTWMRFALGHYLRERCGLEDEVDLASLFRLLPNLDGVEERTGKGVEHYAYADRPDVPLILSSHLPYDRELFAGQRVVLLVRNPADVAVSRWFHVTRQDFSWQGELPAFLRDEDVGLPAILRHLDGWAPHADDPGVLALSYEGLRAAPEDGMARLVAHYGLQADPGAIARALAAASVENMRASEERVLVRGHRYDVADPEARRVRRAVVRGYTDYLSAEDLAWVTRTCAERLAPPARALLERLGAGLQDPYAARSC